MQDITIIPTISISDSFCPFTKDEFEVCFTIFYENEQLEPLYIVEADKEITYFNLAPGEWFYYPLEFHLQYDLRRKGNYTVRMKAGKDFFGGERYIPAFLMEGRAPRTGRLVHVGKDNQDPYEGQEFHLSETNWINFTITDDNKFSYEWLKDFLDVDESSSNHILGNDL